MSWAHTRAPRRESRAHCVDLESAYVQGCERLEQAVLVSASAGYPVRRGPGMCAPAWLRSPCCQAVKALQTATREAIALLQAMVEEVRRSAAEEEAAIHALFGSMQVRVVGTGPHGLSILISHDLVPTTLPPQPGLVGFTV